MGASSGAWLDRTKYASPRLNEQIIERALLKEHVLQCLDDAAVTLVHAPAGFGKTTLLAQVSAELAGAGAGVAWLTCGEEDRQAETLALNLSQSLSAALGHEVPADIGSAVNALERHTGAGRRNLLIIDEAEHLEGSAVAALLERLGMVLADSARLLVAARFRPGFASAQLRLAGRLAIVGPVEIRFAQADALALLGARLPREASEALLARADGWPVVLQLMRQLLKARVDTGQALSLLRDPDSDFFRYVAEQIFDRLPAHARRLLTEIAVLERIEPASVAAITETDDAYATLAELRHLRPILLFGPEPSTSAAIHPLLRDFLLEQLRQDGVARERALRVRAARFYRDRGNVMPAVSQALAAGEPSLAAQIVEDLGGPLLNVSEGAGRARTLLQQLPDELIRDRPKLQLTRLLEMMLNDRAEQALPALGALERTAAQDTPELSEDLEYVESVHCILEHRHAGDPAASARLARSLEHARTRAAEEPRALALHLPLAIIAAQRSAPLREAERLQKEGLEWYAEQGLHRQRPWGLVHQAMIDTAAGRYDAAMKALTIMLPDSLQGLAEVQAMLMQNVNAMVALIAYERGDLALCLERLEHLPELHRACLYEVGHAVVVLRGKALAAAGERDRALLLLRDAGAMAERLDLPNLAAHALTTRVMILQAMGRIEEARGLAETIENEHAIPIHEQDHRPWLLRLDVTLSKINGLLATGAVDEARHLAEWLLRQAQQHGRQNSIAGAQLALARIQRQLGSGTASARSIEAALTSARRGGSAQLFLEQGHEVPLMLRDFLKDPVCAGDEDLRRFITQLLEHWEQAFRGQPAAIELFTDRELEILSELAQGNATKVAARNLAIAPETVKHHLKSIFRKLSVHNRADAVHRARERALIP